MSPLVIYLVKASLMYLLCFLLYWGLFRRETFFIRNRVYLLISLILPALIPLIRFPASSAVADLMPEGGIDHILVVSNSLPATVPTLTAPEIGEIVASFNSFPWGTVVLALYLSGVVFFLSRMLWSYSGIIRLIVRSERKRLQEMILVITRQKVSPFSIFRWLVIPGYKQQHIDLDKIIRHEMIHFRQGHSIDLLLSEFLIVFQWFNPFAWMLKSSIVRNNEFFVDRRCLSWYNDVRSYQYALLTSSFGERRMAMANSFNQDLIKKRIEMMNKKNTRLINRIKDLLIVPFALLLIMAFSAYSGKPAEAVANTAEASVLPAPQAADFQDKVIRKDSAKMLIIRVDGKEVTITDLASAKVDTGDFTILNLKNLGNSWSVLPKDKLNDLLKDRKIDKESALILVRGGKEGDSIKDILGVLKAVDTAGLGSGRVVLENHDGNILIRTKDGSAKMVYVVDKGNQVINIGYSKNVKGKDVLFIVDGKECKAGEWTLTDLDHIEIISILDSDTAVKVYGEKGKNGAIEVTTKK
ncbi:MAG: M56 family metallopeptidase [Bacteroidota bacterium]